MKINLCHLLLITFSLLASQHLHAQKNKSKELVYVDDIGVIRWTANKQESNFFGANYCLPSACDYRAAGYVTNDRKKMVDEDMLHFARMGWNALRLSFWGDFENTDTAGNLINNDHLNIMDYVIAKAKERGIYILLSPIVTYSSLWPDALNDTASIHGISTHFKKSELGTNPQAIAAQQNYLKQLLNHINPYTNTALKDEPNILFIEMINEPFHHSDDLQGSVNYINALIDAVRSTGCNKILFHNYSQDFKMAKALQQSKIQGVTFAWYPTGLNSGDSLQGNYLPVVDHYDSAMLNPKISKLARIVYEFDSPDYLTGYMYPAMARSFREAGAQWASMFSYDMLETAPYNLGWQTHCLNMVYTPAKAISAMIAENIMKIVPRYKNFGNYPTNTLFDSFHIDYEKNLGEMVTAEKFLYTNNTSTTPPDVSALKKIVGFGSSPVVQYEGKGIYFLDKISDDAWRLEIYPDAVIVKDPFNMQSPGKVVIRAIYHSWQMSVDLPGLGKSFSVLPLNANNNYTTSSTGGKFIIQPGVYILTPDKNFNKTSLLAKLGNIGMNEFVCPQDQQLPMQVVMHPQTEYEMNKPVIIKADIYDTQQPTTVTLFVRQRGIKRFMPVPMTNETAYTYSATLPSGNRLHDGWIDYCIVVKKDDSIINFPSGINKSPADWDYYESTTWSSKLVNTNAPLQLINPVEDVNKLAFTRIGDNIRFGIFKLLPASDNGDAAFRLEFPSSYDKTLDDYTISVPVKNKIAPRKDELSSAKSLMLHVKGVNAKEDAYITLVENDGTSWGKKITLQPDWNNLTIPLNELELSKGVMLPLGYPGRWDYWFTPAAGRGNANDKVNMQNVEWVQVSMRSSPNQSVTNKSDSWIEISSANIVW